jgi:hypothetical protein
VKSNRSVKVDMIIGVRTFQIGLPSRIVSYWSIVSSGPTMPGRASACCSATFRATVSS